MSCYRIIEISGGLGFKVQVTGTADFLRVIGIFRTAAQASEWVLKDQVGQPPAWTADAGARPELG